LYGFTISQIRDLPGQLLLLVSIPMNRTFKLRGVSWLVLGIIMCTGVARAEDLHIKCVLVWATNEENSKHKEVGAELEKKLRLAPYKWSHYYEVHHTNVVIHPKQTKKIKMSDHCLLEATNPNDGRIQVNVVGEGKPVSKHLEPLPEGQTLTFGGDAKNDTGWLLLIQRKDPKAEQAK
jgi:hypothetical protein